MHRLAAGFVLALALPGAFAVAQEDFSAWPLLTPSFPSTGGGGVVIGGYKPVVNGPVCTTDFTATVPNGMVMQNRVEFDAVAMQGGVLCTNGRWQSADGGASGTTPLRVFIKDGVARRSP
ncbi:hypothetical protein EDC65_4181 [Stella humosa]|uniref:Uncharacterized protein n=1 Tax=Stella humosa TaxID=94 RepID=A0A3N1KP80_9PROT|nr:hypothetical protein [Stella humosa]ROP83533.1 hypothetical protein EDC65_4181 [Stella humosa]BBK33194.1 hypothetical protein STHU_38280 [Stella humosa]